MTGGQRVEVERLLVDYLRAQTYVICESSGDISGDIAKLLDEVVERANVFATFSRIGSDLAAAIVDTRAAYLT